MNGIDGIESKMNDLLGQLDNTQSMTEERSRILAELEKMDLNERREYLENLMIRTNPKELSDMLRKDGVDGTWVFLQGAFGVPNKNGGYARCDVGLSNWGGSVAGFLEQFDPKTSIFLQKCTSYLDKDDEGISLKEPLLRQ